MTTITSDSWGKTGIRVVKVIRPLDASGTHRILDLDVSTSLRGDTADVYRNGDNAKILTTDAQRNAVYALAKEQSNEDIELLALRLATYFVTSQPTVTHGSVTIRQRSWTRATGDDGPFPHTFHGGQTDTRTVRVEVSPSGTSVYAGVSGLRLLNTTGSEFRGFPRDMYTTGHEVPDRILATEIDAEWLYTRGAHVEGFTDRHASIRAIVINTYASVFSKSIQYTMHAIASAVLAAHPGVTEIRLRVPNIHHYAVDLSPFDLTNDQDIFMTSEGPHSLIEATFKRAFQA